MRDRRWLMIAVVYWSLILSIAALPLVCIITAVQYSLRVAEVIFVFDAVLFISSFLAARRIPKEEMDEVVDGMMWT